MKLSVPSKAHHRNSPIMYILLIFAAFIFVYAFYITDIFWIQDELLFHRFFFSLDGFDRISLHTGLTSSDWLKPFDAYMVDGIFRSRQFSYFLEMVSFKFWQYLGVGFFNNYTLILLHILNIFLVAQWIYHLTENKISAFLGGILFLNSGIGLLTLLFPFRNAKLLVMTLFLLQAVILSRTKGRLSGTSLVGITLCVVLSILALFTDEYAFLLLPILCVLVWMHKRKDEAIFGKIACVIMVTCVGYSLLLGGVFWLSSAVTTKMVQENMGEYFVKLLGYVQNPAFSKDILTSIICLFSNTFGYWSVQWPGLLAFAGFCGIVWNVRLERKFYFLCGAICFYLLSKNILMPHNSGVHPWLMPEGTVFPSLLFFNFYYSYPDALLLCLMLTLGINQAIYSYKNRIMLVISVIIVQIVTVMGLPRSLDKILSFYEYNRASQQVIKNIIGISKYINNNEFIPIYIAFPSGSQRQFDGRPGKAGLASAIYARIISVMFLKDMEEQRVKTALDLLRTEDDDAPLFNFQEAKTYYDAPSQSFLILDTLQKGGWNGPLASKMIHKYDMIDIDLPKEKKQKLLFFIRGQANIEAVLGDAVFPFEQFYGESYQLFYLDIPSDLSSHRALIRILPHDLTKGVELVGPFIAEL